MQSPTPHKAIRQIAYTLTNRYSTTAQPTYRWWKPINSK